MGILTCRKIAVLLMLMPALCRLLSAQPAIYPRYADPGAEYENRVIDLVHLEATVTPDTLNRIISGTAVYTFRPIRPQIDTISMFAPGIQPLSVSINRSEVRFTMSDDNLVITGFPPALPAEGNVLQIQYRSSGSAEPYFVGWDDSTRRMRRQIWAHRPFGWIPYLNDRLTVDLTITFNSNYPVFSNGQRISVSRNADGTSSWHYRMSKPHPFFSTALVIGEYAWKEMKTTSGIPLEYWYYPDMEDHFEPTYRYSIEMFDFLEGEFGVTYPWPVYRQAPVADYLYGAMETTTSTIFGDYMAIDERGWWGRNYVNVNVHELVHQWFGNCIAHQPGSDVWLTESLATYYAKLFERSVFGVDHYEKERLSEQKKALEQAGKDDYPLAHSLGGISRWYQKGSLVLDMLRDELGDSLFRKAMTHYLRKFAFGEASSHDFIKAVYEATGVPLQWFFNQWLFGGGEPHFEVSFEGNNPSFTELRVMQKQPDSAVTGLFRVSATVLAGYSDGSTSGHTIKISGRESLFRLPNTKGLPVTYLVFDSGNRLLKKLTFKRTPGQLAAAALNAPLAIDRYEALTNLRPMAIQDKRNILLAAVRKSENELIFSEVLEQLKGDRNQETASLFAGALRHPDALIRRAAILHFTPEAGSDTALLVRMLTDPDYINVERSLRKLCALMPGRSAHWLSVTAGETGWRGRNIRIAWLEITAGLGSLTAIAELKDFAGVSFEFETRINAIKALKNLDFLDYPHAKNLVKAYRHWNPKLSGPAGEAITGYLSDEEHKPFIEKALKEQGIELPAGR